ncbi:MAG TPA: YggS family pyridoxal phosphate-dependent enzyme [Chloroflexota bacterium]|nr:YggS family pyridoxal phosphate-dependent enzyme [Chloroflexota bacterium]
MTTDPGSEDVAARLARIRERIALAAARAGRSDEANLVAVTKGVDIERIRAAWSAGQRMFGENRLQEALLKIGILPDAEWHLIGHLQTNKAASAARSFALIQSVDSTRLALKLGVAGERLRRTVPVLVEVNIAGEQSKTGFAPEGLDMVLEQLAGIGGLELRGLMTVAPLVGNPGDIRWVFRELRQMRDRTRSSLRLESLSELSMGMSDDFEVAVEEGATMVRIGRAIFGARPALEAS